MMAHVTEKDFDTAQMIGERALVWLEKLRAEIDTDLNFDRYVVIDGETGQHALGDSKQEAVRRFTDLGGDMTRGVIFHVGHI